MAAVRAAGTAQRERWSWPWAQEKTNSVRTSSTPSSPGVTPPTKEEATQPTPATVASLDGPRSSDSRRSSKRRLAKEPPAPFVQIRRPAETPPAQEWTNLNAPAEAAREMTWETLVEVEDQRQKLLSLARSAAAIDTVFRLSLLPRTVIPRLRLYKSFWFVLAVYGISATLTRLGYDIEDSLAREILASGSSFVAFMIVFYVGDSAPAPAAHSRWPTQAKPRRAAACTHRLLLQAPRRAVQRCAAHHELHRERVLDGPCQFRGPIRSLSHLALRECDALFSLLRLDRSPDGGQLFHPAEQEARAARGRKDQGNRAGRFTKHRHRRFWRACVQHVRGTLLFKVPRAFALHHAQLTSAPC